MQSRILDEVEWKMHSLMKQFIEQERRAGPGVNSSGYMSWTMSPGVRVSPEGEHGWTNKICLCSETVQTS